MLLTATLLGSDHAFGVVLDGGVDPNNLGKGEWVYILSSYFGGYAPQVTNAASLMSYCATNLQCQFVVVKAGTGSTNFPSASQPQFTAALVSNAHAAGLKIFGYTFSYGTDIPGETAIANYCFNCGADGFILDAESVWESSVAVGSTSTVGTNGPALAMQLCGGIKTNWPTKFLAHSPFAIISYHSTFPYQQFGYWCDAVMPQDYWVDFGMTPAATVQWMDSNWGPWQNGLSGIWTNAVKPLVPIGEADNTNQPGTDITAFVNYLQTDTNCVTAAGYNGCVFFRPGLQTPVMLSAIAGTAINSNRAPGILSPPQSQNVFAGQNVTFSAEVTGSPTLAYQWFYNNQSIIGATNLSYTLTNAQLGGNGSYALTASNSAGVITSASALLVVQTNFTTPLAIIIDNTNANCTSNGSWSVGTSDSGKYGPSYIYAATVTGSLTATAIFTPAIVTPGNYDVSIWYPAASNHPTNAPWAVVTAAGTVNASVNEQINGAQWFRIATNVTFAAGNGSHVVLGNTAGPSYVFANAVQLVYSSVQPPIIQTQPQNMAAWLGSSATFSVQAAAYGTGALSYQWSVNGTNIIGATSNSYTITNVQGGNARSYAVTVSDAAGSTISVLANLSVEIPTIYFNSITLLTNGQVVFQVGGDPVSVVLQESADLLHWVSVASGSLANGPTNFYDSTTNAALFYRLRNGP